MRSARSSRGYSLLELMIALGVSVIVIAGALALVIAQQRTFQSTSRDRALQEGARVALETMVADLRNAGFGVDPALAFDLGPQTAARADRAYGNLSFKTTSTAKGDGSACAGLCRDSVSTPDEIVFYARDASFGPHPLVVAANSASSSLTVALVPGQTTLDLSKGQVLQVACYTGNMTWAYVTVSGAPTINAAAGTASIPIANAGSADFPNQTSFLADACFTSFATWKSPKVLDTASVEKATEVFKVDRYHYYVQSYDAAGTAVSWNTPGARPYLMLDQGLRDKNGAPILSVIAPDVDDVQFEYVFPYDAVAPVVGAAGAIANSDTGINLAPAAGCPTYSDPVTPTPSPTRQNHHPGNVGAVRVAVVVRSSVPDYTLTGRDIPASGNRDKVVGDAGYARMRVETTVRVPNLATQAPYYPTYGDAAAVGSRTLNVGGG